MIMRVFVVFLIGVALLRREANAGPIWDRARRMFGWDKSDGSNQNAPVASATHSYSGSAYPSNGPPQRPVTYGASAPPGVFSAPYGSNRPPSYSRPETLQHASSAVYGSYAPASYGGQSYGGQSYGGQSYGPPSYMRNAYGNYPTAGSPYGSYSQGEYGAPSASNNYGGLFSVVDQTSQIGQLANGDLAAAPSEPYATSNEYVMKSLMKMVSKPFDLDTAASGPTPYYQQSGHIALSPGPHPIMEADRHVIRYRTSPIQIGVADAFNQGPTSPGHAAGLSTSQFLTHGIDTSAYAATSEFTSGALTSPYSGDLHVAASSSKKSVANGALHKQ